MAVLTPSSQPARHRVRLLTWIAPTAALVMTILGVISAVHAIG